VQQFQLLKMEVEEQFAGEIHAILPLFQRHTQLTVARYFNDASVQGGNAMLPRIMDLSSTSSSFASGLNFHSSHHAICLPLDREGCKVEH
jgi:predicted RNA methylase